MMNTPASALAQTGRYLLALPLALGLAVGVGTVLPPATAAPLTVAAAPGPAVYYLDGQLSNKATVDALDPKSISYINMLDAKQSLKVFGTATGEVAIIVTTANQNSAAVLALNKKIDKVAPLVPATPAQKAATAAIQAYLLKNYPNAKVHFIGGGPKTDTAKPPYQAEFEDGGQTRHQYFDAQGQPVGQATSSKPVGVVLPAAPAQAAQPVPYLAAPALAYITKNYPDARLLEMTEVPAPTGSASTYKALLAIGRRPVSLLFDERGGFISEVSSAR